MLQHCFLQANIIAMFRIGPAITIQNKIVLAEAIVVGSFRCCGDRERDFGKDLRFENSLRAYQGNAFSFKLKSLGEDFSRDNVTIHSDALRE